LIIVIILGEEYKLVPPRAVYRLYKIKKQKKRPRSKGL
jgi:hypothetical protein